MNAAELAHWQMALDAQRTKRFPWLTAVKRERMLVSPHAFLRGSADLFYKLMPRITSPVAWLVGDMHVENVGAYRTDDDRVVFDLNDFDAAGRGPVVYDVLRLLTSVLLTGRAFALNGPRAIALAQDALEAWQRAAATGRVEAQSESIREIMARAEHSELGAYLDERAPERKGKRRFERGSRYHALVAPWTTRAESLLAKYVDHKMIDAAHRTAGTGSLGCVRIAYVVKSHHYRLVEIKEALPPPVKLLGPRDHATRIVEGANALVAAPPRALKAIPGFVGRRLEPQQQKLNLLDTPRNELAPVVTHIAGLLGRAHRRTATEKLHLPKDTLTHAISLAGLHEAIYLSYSGTVF